MTMIRFSKFSTHLWAAIFCGVFVAIAASRASAADPKDLSALVSQVDPCVVTITLSNQSEGSGFLVDKKGLLVTNYHVMEGAKSATVGFPNKKQFPVDGFLAIDKTKDLALVHISLPADSEEVPVLRLSDALPAKGERVFAFGAPLGLSGSVSDGIVAAVRPGADVSETLSKLTHQDIYGKVLGYDLEAEWIQTTAPISPGNSGGPLVNTHGEVVGVNTWVCAVGQNLNFSLSVKHLQKFIAQAGSVVQPLSNLPAPRRNREALKRGDAQKTLHMWKQLNRFKNTLAEKTTVAEKKLAKIVPIDPRKTMKGKTNRDKKKAIIYDGMAKDYTDYAANVRALDSTGVDTDVLLLSISEADLAQRISDACEQLSNGLNAQSDHAEWEGDWKMSMFRDSVTRLRTAREIIRVGLNRKYDIQFPTLEQTAKSTEEEDDESVAKGNSKEPSDHSDAAASKSDDVVASTNTENASLRIWTDRTGRHQVQAKYLGLDSGKVKLKKADGTIVRIPIASLSEADQRFIGIVP